MQLVQHLIRHPIHQPAPPVAIQSLNIPPPVPYRTSSAEATVPALSSAASLDGRSSSSTIPSPAAHPAPIPVPARPSSQRPSVNIHYEPSVSSAITSFRMAEPQQSSSPSHSHSHSASLPVTSTRSRSTSSTSPKSVSRPVPSPPTHPVSTKPAAGTVPAAASSASSPYSSINHTNSFITTSQPSGSASTYSPKAFRSSPPPVITLGMTLKPGGLSVASPSPSSAPPSYPSSSSQSPPSQQLRLSSQDNSILSATRAGDRPYNTTAAGTAAAGSTSASVVAVPRASSTKSSSKFSHTQPSSSTQHTPSASPVDLPTPPSNSPPIVPMRPSLLASPDRKDSLTLHSPVLHRKDSELIDDLLDHPIPLGTLKILPPKPSKTQPSSQSSPTHSVTTSSSIADPHAVVHTVHVKYDPTTRQYSGLPAHMMSALQQQFGLPPTAVDRMQLAGYAARIPVVLVELQRCLRQADCGGLRAEGVFRIAPDADECGRVKRSMDKGERLTCRDVYVIANLIKIWYRDLPGKKVLDEVDASLLGLAGDSVEAAGRVVAAMSELYGSLFVWLLDVCCEVVRCSEWNKMTSKALGIVMAPNLFTPSGDDPMGSMLQVQKVALFVQRAIDWRMEQPPPPPPPQPL